MRKFLMVLMLAACAKPEAPPVAVAAAPVAAPVAVAAPQYEYLLLTIPTRRCPALLNKLGAEGWDAVSIEPSANNNLGLALRRVKRDGETPAPDGPTLISSEFETDMKNLETELNTVHAKSP